MTQMLVVYRRSKGELIEAKSLGDDVAAAMKARFAREMVERTDPDVEVVVLSGSSDDALRKTHGRYFKGMDELLGEVGTASSESGVTRDEKTK